jgi:hypothetical protein
MRVLILKEGTSRSRGREAQRNNIMAAKILAEVDGVIASKGTGGGMPSRGPPGMPPGGMDDM